MDHVRRSYRVCHIHFGPESLYLGRWNKSSVKRDGVPTLFLANASAETDVANSDATSADSYGPVPTAASAIATGTTFPVDAEATPAQFTSVAESSDELLRMEIEATPGPSTSAPTTSDDPSQMGRRSRKRPFLEGFRYLWDVLRKERVSFLCPRNLNQDCLENFFGCIRSHGVRNVSPNAAAFVNSFKSLIINNYLANRSKSFNCESDNLRAFDNLKQFLSSKVTTTTAIRFPEVTIPEYRPTDTTLLRRGTLTYVAGFVAKRVLSKVARCKQCRLDLLGDDRTAKEYFVIQARAYSPNALLSPTYLPTSARIASNLRRCKYYWRDGDSAEVYNAARQSLPLYPA
ncbi:uncharacterized protein LOC108734938 [Agrilus planipennis]|uniref:Uncharacterized protein LOC108734938 n=1 Tax=Agrilus planipennis TaxID=224129 RepID=A0A1W4WQ21_AGRPL|nr:uncharacterized protein LOC108734938 [Agrilus planipennis]